LATVLRYATPAGQGKTKTQQYEPGSYEPILSNRLAPVCSAMLAPDLLPFTASPQTIQASSDDDLFDALCTAHSFYDRLRFFPGGLSTWRNVFREANDPTRARNSLSYLLHGPGNVEERMANLIYSPAYKLNEFGQANVQELIGWCNKEDLPVINGRTTKVLRWFGFDVAQL
jgi:hypothetical protein